MLQPFKMKNILSLVTATLFAGAAVAQSTYGNPIVWEDFADLDVFRVNDAFYYSASTMHYSPGAPILRSYDLVNWELIGHSVPELDWGNKYYLNGNERAYVDGIWASSMRYRKSNGLWYWYGCSDFATTWVYTATDPAGTWTKAGQLNKCFYDVGILIDDDDTMYLAYDSTNIKVAQLTSNGLGIARDQQVYGDGRYIEGSRFYKRNGRYYIWVTKPANEQHVLVANSPFGPYTAHQVLANMASPIASSGTPHQGALVDTPNGDWYYMAFLDAYPLGRIPVLAPITWDGNGIPKITTGSNGGWGSSYTKPNIQTSKVVTPVGAFTDTFTGSKLRPEWEWNHNPDKNSFSLGSGGLTLKTATVNTDLYDAKNTLTTRTLGPRSSGTFRLNVKGMANGDIAGVAIFRDESSYIGIKKDNNGAISLVIVKGITMSESSGWNTVSEGSQVTSTTNNLSGVADGSKDLWLRATVDVTPTFGGSASRNVVNYYYSTDGSNFTQLGGAQALHNRWQFFMAFRFAVFNFATRALGGSVQVKEFALKAA